MQLENFVQASVPTHQPLAKETDWGLGKLKQQNLLRSRERPLKVHFLIAERFKASL